MPLYEYNCPHCDVTFELLRPFSRADDAAPCPECQGIDTRRKVSTFASFSKGSDGTTTRVGGGGCAGCASGGCATCNHHH
ncbi:MAG TPA: zinc ribbon domain-containing protein [Chloroflexi bacterium]|jgi:putative FmdB family regulatory protein|nr:zinc ribbon domain-containing protein [Chloroflexota bacterium]